MKAELITETFKKWSWRKFRMVEHTIYKVATVRKTLVWNDSSYGNGLGCYVGKEKATTLQVFDNLADALDFLAELKNLIKDVE